MRLALPFVLAAVALTGPAAAAADPSGSPVAAPPLCTTTTTVVRRGDAVLSTTSTTRCEDASASQGFHPGAVLAAPGSVLGALAFGHGEELTARNAAGDWRVIEGRAERICHLLLSARAGASGFLARGAGCGGRLAAASGWSFQDGAVGVTATDGAPIVRLTGDREHLSGTTADGETLVLQR